MPNFQVTAPDGSNYQVTAPDGATQDQVMAYVQQQHAAKTPAPQQPAPAQQQAGGAGDAFSNGLANTATLGLATPALSGVEAVLSHILPGPTESFAQRQVANTQQQQQTAAAHPVANVVGDIAGAIAPTKLLAAAMPFKSALALKAAAQGGTKLGNAARLAAQGGLVGGAYGGASGAVQGARDDGLSGAGEGLVKGGAEGAALGAAGDLGAAGLVNGASSAWKGMFSDAGQKSIAVLAKAFGKSPNDVGAAVSKFRLDTGGTMDPATGQIKGGRMPAMGELSDLWNRGEIASVVNKNPNLGAPVAAAADDAATALPGRLAAQVENTVGQTATPHSPAMNGKIAGGEDPADLVAARDKNIKSALDPIRQDQVPLAPEDVEFIRHEVLPNSGLTQLGRRAVHEDLDQGVLTVGNADTLRQSLRARAQANPGEGYDHLANGIAQVAADGSQEYGQALDKYGTDSRYIDAHAHGLTGKTPGQTDDPNLIAALKTPEGQQGYQSGIATRLANRAFASEGGAASTAADLSQQAGTAANLGNTFSPARVDALRDAAGAESRGLESLQSIAPSMPKAPEKTGLDAKQVGLAVVSHNPGFKLWHGVKAIAGGGMSDNVAKITAKYLTDPRMTEQGVNLLRKYGADQATIQKLMQQAGAVGAVAANGQ